MTQPDQSALADLICRDVAELPDRTSPDDWPEAMLVTAEELHLIVTDHLTALASPTFAAGVEAAVSEFRDALAATPFLQDRLAKGQQFNAYESADNEDEEDPLDWEYFLSLGPITNCVQIMRIEGEWRAKLIEAALRVALRTHCAILTPTPAAPPAPDSALGDEIGTILTAATLHGSDEIVLSTEKVRQIAVALRQPAPRADDALRGILTRMEAACDALCAKRSQETYLRMIDVDGAQDELLALDDARAEARKALASDAPTDDKGD